MNSVNNYFSANTIRYIGLKNFLYCLKMAKIFSAIVYVRYNVGNLDILKSVRPKKSLKSALKF